MGLRPDLFRKSQIKNRNSQMADGVLFDRESAAQIAETVRRSWPRGHVGRPLPVPAQTLRQDLVGILLDDLEPATHPRVGAKAARVRCYAPDPGDVADFSDPDKPIPRVPQLTTRVEWCINRDIDAQAVKGTFVVMRWTALAEWHWIVLGCGPACSGGSVDWTSDGTQWTQDVDTLGGNECSDGCWAPEPDEAPTVSGATASTDCMDEAFEGFLE